MIISVEWNEIYEIWKSNLWPDRQSAIETNSAMSFNSGFNNQNMQTKSTFFAFKLDNKVVGVNSGHMCFESNYRSRGLWVDENYRGRGIGTTLLLHTINQGILEGADYVWSYPRKTSWNTYQKAGFVLTSEWLRSETSESNAYCYKKL